MSEAPSVAGAASRHGRIRLAALTLGVAKEIYDRAGRGDPNPCDALATGAGCSVSFAF